MIRFLVLALLACALLPGWIALPVQAAVDAPEPTPGSPGTDWSLLTLEVQKALRSARIYDGPVNGRGNLELEQTIRAYQETNNLPITGTVTNALLNHIQDVTLPATLLSRLQRVKRDNIAEARTQLLDNAATRDLVVAAPGAEAADPTRSIAPCLSDPNFQCLINEAVESSKAVNRQEFRQWVLRDILKALTHAGRTDEARQAIRRIGDPRMIQRALKEQVGVFSRIGAVGQANALARTIPDPALRAQAFAGIMADHPDRIPDLRATLLADLEQVTDPLVAIEVLSALATDTPHPHRTAFLNRAEDRLAALPDARRPHARRLLLQAKVRLGDARAYRQLKADLLQDEETATLVAVMCDFADAEPTRYDPDKVHAILDQAAILAKTYSKKQSHPVMLHRLARSLAQAGRWPRATALIETIDDPIVRAKAYWDVAGIATDTGTVRPSGARLRQKALKAIEGTQNRFRRARMLTDFADSALTRQDGQQGARLFRKALHLSNQVKSSWWRARLFSRLALVSASLQRAASAPPQE